MEEKYPIIISKKIKPIHCTLRKTFDLTVGNKYYVSFGSNRVYACFLEEILQEPSMIIIKMIKENGETESHQLYPDEIGRTPEEAVINTVTS